MSAAPAHSLPSPRWLPVPVVAVVGSWSITSTHSLVAVSLSTVPPQRFTQSVSLARPSCGTSETSTCWSVTVSSPTRPAPMVGGSALTFGVDKSMAAMFTLVAIPDSTRMYSNCTVDGKSFLWAGRVSNLRSVCSSTMFVVASFSATTGTLLADKNAPRCRFACDVDNTGTYGRPVSPVTQAAYDSVVVRDTRTVGRIGCTYGGLS